jgi:phage terminase large subunit
MAAEAVVESEVRLPPKLLPVFGPARGDVQYRSAYGGRGSAKSATFATMAAVWGYAERLRILCTRDTQSSIKESFHAELKASIEARPWLAAHYDVGVDYLRGRNGTEFLFKGLRHNLGSIKSTAKVDLTIVEEAEDVHEDAWVALEATVLRQPRSEIWTIWNPRTDGSPVDKRFRGVVTPSGALVAEMNWRDNPWFPSGLDKLRRLDQSRLDPQTYAHIWEGDYLRNSASQVLSGKVRVAEFNAGGPGWDGPYQGLDYGFALDPTAFVRCWIKDDRLWIDHEAGGRQLELDATARALKSKVAGAESFVTRADSARPESTSYLQRHGMPLVKSVDKWPGSVEDGIAYLRGFAEIVVHPRCKETINETRLWSYKVDRLSGDVLPALVDSHNHYMDALRYALQPMIKRRGAMMGTHNAPGL